MSEAVQQDISCQISGSIAVVELDRPPHNFVDASMLAELADTLEQLDENSQVRAIVLAANGKAFCAGADFGKSGAGSNTARAFYAEAVRLFKVRKPIVAAIEGACVGAGLGLALVADFRVAPVEARFAANFVKIGLHPGFGVTRTLPRIVGEQAAALLLYTGRRIDGAEAHRIGLTDIICDFSAVRQTAIELAEEIAANAPLAVNATRNTLRQGLAEDVEKQARHELAEQAPLFDTHDFREGVHAVAERRTANFVGQ
jgi:enoyl-CoA hydratase/carnithine racemase